MAEITSFDKGGRESRRALVAAGRAPRDFFYGVLELQEQGYDIEEMSSAVPYTGVAGRVHRALELTWSHVTRLGLRTHFLDTVAPTMRATRIAISFTDGFSLTLGHHYRHRRRDVPYLIGCFHGLCDIESRAPLLMQPVAKQIIRRALQRLDYVAFFGPADRERGIREYGLDRDKTGLILFGVDTAFWTPAAPADGDYFFAIGQDPSRDFDTLVSCEVDLPIRLHTALPIVIPPGRANVHKTAGSYHRSTLDDEELRRLYQEAMAIVVPLKDVYQPSGYSVTLQAMACGKPVILSRNRGLWAPELLRHEENCLLVTPGDRGELAGAMNRIAADPALRARLGSAARDTVLQHFTTGAAAVSLERMIRIGRAATAGWPGTGAAQPAAGVGMQA